MCKRSLLVALLLGMLTSVGITQKTFQPKQPGQDWKGIVYRKETAFEMRLQTNGPLLFGVNIGEIKTYYRTDYYHFSLGFMKDPRERRQNKNRGLGFNTSTGFVLGKQNSVLVLRGGMGTKRFLSEKAKRKGVAVGYDYEIGPSLALMKPYYLQIAYPASNGSPPTLREERYSEDNAAQFLDEDGTVFGGTSYFKGFGEMVIIPGLQAKAGVFFSLKAFDDKVKAVETGIMVDVYIKKLPIMVENENLTNRPYFINFYVNLLLGSRRN